MTMRTQSLPRSLVSIALGWLAGLLLSTSAWAQLNVEIIGGNTGGNEIPVATTLFAGESVAPLSVTDVIRADLARSGRLRNVDPMGTVASEILTPDYAAWRGRGADALVSGSVYRVDNGQYEIKFKLYDVKKQAVLGGLAYTVRPQQFRATAHKIADYIYEKLLGERGAFATRLSYVAQKEGEYRLLISDSDGQNAIPALTSQEPIISPSWSPDGTKVAYVSFEDRKPVVYVHDLPSGQRTLIANQKGNNSAPAWSPDGQRLALALSQDGNTQVYVAQADGKALQRLSRSTAIDTEPQFSPDGQTIFFTSDRSGGPQIYRMSAQEGEQTQTAQRVTFKGNFNTSPRLSPDGKTLAFIGQVGRAYRVHTLNLQTGDVFALTQTAHDEAPTFAANGKFLLYATRVNGQHVLAAVSVDGRSQHILSLQAGAVREPAWGPFMK